MTKNKLSRTEKNELTKQNLFDAAIQVVGEMGYRDASVADITARAEIAQGTFYNYFESKQDILDQLLPELGQGLLEFLGSQVGEATYLEREERSLRAYFEFIRNRPEFYRILTEAQVYAPQSFKKHSENLVKNYLHSLERTKENGYLADYSPEEFEAIAAILLGARVYLMTQFCFKTNKVRPIPEHVLHTFMKFITCGFGGSSSGGNKRKAIRQALVEETEGLRREVLKVSDDELTISYQTPAHLAGSDSAASDLFVRQLTSDLITESMRTLLESGTRLRSIHVDVISEKLPMSILGKSRIEQMSPDVGIISLRLSGTMDGTLVHLAAGQASFVRG